MTEDEAVPGSGSRQAPDGPGAHRRDDRVGVTLRAARRRLGHTLVEAARELQLPPTSIAALEGEHFSAFGDETQAQVHLRCYAEFLGLDPEPLLRRHAGSGEPEPSLPQATDERPPGSLPLRSVPRQWLDRVRVPWAARMPRVAWGAARIAPFDLFAVILGIAIATLAVLAVRQPPGSDPVALVGDAETATPASGAGEARQTPALGPDQERRPRAGQRDRRQARRQDRRSTPRERPAADSDRAGGSPGPSRGDGARERARSADRGATDPRVPPEEISVQVLDGAYDQQRLDDVVAALSDHGYEVVSISVARRKYRHTTVFYTKGWKAEARALREADGRFGSLGPSNGLTKEIDLHVVVGKDWDA